MNIIVTGSNGLLGQHLVTRLVQLGHHTVGLGRGENRLPNLAPYLYEDIDITDGVKLQDLVRKHRPECIIHAAAMTQVDQCEQDKQQCYNVNVSATRFLLDAAVEVGSRVIYVSTDFVFDGNSGPYTEDDEPRPVNYYGSTKLAAEKAVMEAEVDWVIVRTVLVYGDILQGTRTNIIQWVKDNLEQNKAIKVVSDQFRTPTYIDDLVDGIIKVLDQQVSGIYHISGKDGLTPYEMAIKTANYFNLDAGLIEKVDASSFQQLGQRPLRTGFKIDKARKELGFAPINFEESLKRMFSK